MRPMRAMLINLDIREILSEKKSIYDAIMTGMRKSSDAKDEELSRDFVISDFVVVRDP